MLQLARDLGLGDALSFNEAFGIETLATAIYDKWFATQAWQRVTPLSTEAFRPYTAEALTQQLAGIFDAVAVAHTRRPA